jgi:hypothetical protein
VKLFIPSTPRLVEEETPFPNTTKILSWVPIEPENKNGCVGEGQQKLPGPGPVYFHSYFFANSMQRHKSIYFVFLKSPYGAMEENKTKNACSHILGFLKYKFNKSKDYELNFMY